MTLVVRHRLRYGRALVLGDESRSWFSTVWFLSALLTLAWIVTHFIQ
jgi:hypothetical protein